MVLDIVKLEKLKIKAFKDKDRTDPVLEPFEVMFNPESFSRRFEIQYSRKEGQGVEGPEVKYLRSKPSSLKLKLVLDGTGVSEMGIVQLGEPPTVSDRIKAFLELAYQMDGESHEPHYLTVEWGDLAGEHAFECRLGAVDITYTSFDLTGKPLRAELDVSLISAIPGEKREAKVKKQSADLTHSRRVIAGDTLPLLTKDVYGSSIHYLRVAQFNDLDNFRALVPGQEIVFPPLET